MISLMTVFTKLNFFLNYRRTNDDGRLPGLITKEQFTLGRYKMFFDTGAYFEALNITTFYPQVEVKDYRRQFIFNTVQNLKENGIFFLTGCLQHYQH